MHFLPILSTLRRHRTAAALIVLEIALTCAIVCNTIFPIRERIAHMQRPSGIVEDELIAVKLAGIGTKADADALTAQDLAALRRVPGVKSVASTNMIPFGGSSWNSDISTIRDDPAAVTAAMYMGTEDLLETWGVQLVAGRDFTPTEYINFTAALTKTRPIPSIILTRQLADRLFHHENPLGKSVYVWDKEPLIVVGIIEHIARPNENGGPAHASYAMVLPVTIPYPRGRNYLVRVEPTRLAEVLATIDATLDKIDPARIILERKSFAEVRAGYFHQDRAMGYLLGGVSIALLIVTAIGVVGLASFWVQQRTRQIGIRRALGATRSDILHYFQLENFILATLGIVLGMPLAYAINLWLMSSYQAARLPAAVLPSGAMLLWLLGQIAVLVPALRAATIPPAVATRAV